MLDTCNNGITVKLDIMAGHCFRYHRHEKREEIWVIMEGEGTATLNGERIALRPGVTVSIPVGTMHMLEAQTPMKVIETQIGKEILFDDKKFHEV